MTVQPFKVLFIYPNMMMMHLIPSGVAVLSAALKQQGIEVRVFDTTYYRTDEDSAGERKVDTLQVKPFNMAEKGIEINPGDPATDLRRMVWEYLPDLIAVSCVEDTWSQGLSLLQSISDYCRERRVPVIAGGVFPTYAPEKVIREDLVDMACVGEGDEALPELCERLRKHEDPSGVKNIWVKAPLGANGKRTLVRNPMRDPVEMDRLPTPDFSVFDPKRLYRPMAGTMYTMAPIETHRGCPYKCSFCNSPAIMQIYREGTNRNFLRMRSPEKTVEEIKYLKERWNLEYIFFNADTFLAISEDELKTLSALYRREIDLPFWMETRPETFNPTRIRYLEEMGIHRCSMGIEHGDEEFRRRVIHRNYSNDQLVRVFDLLNGSKIPVTVNNMIGFPEETRDLAFKTIDINRFFNADSVNCHVFVPYHGTPLRQTCIERGFLDADRMGGGGYTPRDAVMNMPQFPPDQISGLMRTFVMYVKFERNRYGEIERAESLDEAGNAAFDQLRLEYVKRFYRGATSDT